MRLLSLFGLTVAMVSFLYGLYMFVVGLLGYAEVRGFTTVVVLLAFFGGSIMLMLGMIAEYIWRIFDHVVGYPDAVIDEIF